MERPTRTLGYLLAQTPTQLIDQVAGNLGRSGCAEFIVSRQITWPAEGAHDRRRSCQLQFG